MKQRWTADAECAVRGWWAEGKTGGDIQLLLETQIGFYTTRNGVMGKLNKLGLLGKRRGPSPGRGIVKACFKQAWAEVRRRKIPTHPTATVTA